MDRFRPLRSSPPSRPSKTIPDNSDVSSTDALAIELRDLTADDVELLDAVIERAGPSATTFLTVFKAYSEVLTDRGLDPHEVVYYGKLLKLGTMKGRNWGEKWEKVKAERRKVCDPILNNDKRLIL
jgi:protein SFI1